MSAINTTAIDSANLYNPLPSFAPTPLTSTLTQLASSSSSTGQSLDIPTPGSALLPNATSQIQADFNGDGQEDVLWRNYANGQNVVWFMNGTTMITFVSLTTVKDTNWRIEGTGDFTGDGQTDILWRNYNTGQNVIWMMNGTTLVSGISLATVKGTNWQVQGTGDFTGDGKTDILWRNYDTGKNLVWAMNGTVMTTSSYLTSAPGTNLRIAGTGDFNGDGQVDILWRNYLSGDNFVWFLNGLSISSTASLSPEKNLNWQIRGVGDYNQDGQLDLLGWNSSTGEATVWLMNNFAVGQKLSLKPVPTLSWQAGQQDVFAPPSAVTINNLLFSGQEGDSGTFQIQLKQAPTSTVTVAFTAGSFLSVDANNDLRDGTQTTLTFTPGNWNRPQTVWFIAEVDGSNADRVLSNTIAYTLSGGLSAQGTVELASIANTYAPDPTRFNIDLDFRNDYLGFWTPARRAIAQQAANDWAGVIANEWNDFQLNNTLGRLENGSAKTYRFATQRYVDDLLIFVNDYIGNAAGEAALGGPDYEFGGWITSPELMPRVGQIAISPAIFTNQSDQILYDVVSHEIGHVLGLVGLNWLGYSLEDRTNPQAATFNGAYATQANGGNPIPLQSQEGGDFAHPAAQVRSIMSYNWIYNLSGPTVIDYAMLADSGYRVYGVNNYSNAGSSTSLIANTTTNSQLVTRAAPAALNPEDV